IAPGAHRGGGDGYRGRVPHLQHPAGRGAQRRGGADRGMRRVVAIALLLAPATACAFRVALRDEATGQPVDGAFVIAREWATVGKLHGTDDYCVRADITPSIGPFVTMDLPNAGTDMVTRARGVEVIAYRPSYCLARTESGRTISSYKYMHLGEAAPKEIDSGGETRMPMRRAGPDAEE